MPVISSEAKRSREISHLMTRQLAMRDVRLVLYGAVGTSLDMTNGCAFLGNSATKDE